jgi:hypothetical protein
MLFGGSFSERKRFASLLKGHRVHVLNDEQSHGNDRRISSGGQFPPASSI